MTIEQPDAIKLAEWLETSANTRDKRAAVELRRLHQITGELKDALEDICSAAGSINHGKQHCCSINDEVVYWQREEWVRWILDEIIPNSKAVLKRVNNG